MQFNEIKLTYYPYCIEKNKISNCFKNYTYSRYNKLHRTNIALHLFRLL